MTLEDIGGWPAVLGRICAGEDLTTDEAAATMGEVLAGNATPAQIAALAVGLRMKGETVAEMVGLVGALLAVADTVSLAPEIAEAAIDTCGTGGDRSGTINVSTVAALVAAGAGAKVCKHGNRAATSQAGSADVLEALGVVIDLGPDGVVRCIEETGIGFCLAPRFHPSYRHAAPVRKELGVPTVFNFLGPLANPARVRRQVIGVSDARMAPKILGVLEARGASHAIVVFGHDGLDELTTTSTSVIHELHDGAVRDYVVDPAALGLAPAAKGDLLGADPATNAACVRAVLDGTKGAHRDIVLLNAAAALMVAGIADGFEDGLKVGADSIDSGRAATVLDELVRVSKDAAT